MMSEEIAFSGLAEQLARSDSPAEILNGVLERLDALREEVGRQIAAGAEKARFDRLNVVADALVAARHVVVLGYPKMPKNKKDLWQLIH